MPPFLRQISGGSEYAWYSLPPHGRSGGILVGFDVRDISVQSIVSGDFCVKFQVKNKLDGFSWVLVVVYGAAQADRKPNFVG